MRAKVNIMSRQNPPFVQQVSNLWAKKFKNITSVRTECGATFRNKRFVSTARAEVSGGPLVDLNADFGSFTTALWVRDRNLGIPPTED